MKLRCAEGAAFEAWWDGLVSSSLLQLGGCAYFSDVTRLV